jgi:hypothetical protein
MGMPKSEVIGALGKPTWVVLPTDTGERALPDSRIALELYWANPGCTPVVVQFNASLRATGWDEGRLCVEGVEVFNPTEDVSCSKPDRREHCE